MRLREIIVDEIRTRGPIPFSRYMELCLYHPELGYYSRKQEKFGKTGDFYTSSDVHAVFGRLLARQFDEMWRSLGSPERIDVVELGPGRGLFAADVLAWSQRKFSEFAAALRYVLVESSPGLQGKLRERFESEIAAGSVALLAQLPSGVRENAIIFANEFFDALPVEVVAKEGSLRIGEDAGDFVETFVPASAAELEFLDRHSVHPGEHERVEATLAAVEWMRRVAPLVRRGYMVAIDYGYTREEQLAGRHRGTVKAIRQHAISDSPYEAPGEQDITADVNFTALRETGREAGLEPLGFVTQSQFLMGIGEKTEFADAFEDTRLPQERAKVALQLKCLVTPAGMGESFHVLVMGSGVEAAAAKKFAGLSFAR